MGAKAILRSALEMSIGIEQFQDSALYHFYMRFFYPESIQRKVVERAFYANLLGEPRGATVFDIGANSGAKARIFSDLGFEVVVLEPDPTAFASLQRRFAGEKKVKLLQAACGADEGEAEFHVLERGGPYNTLSEKWADLQQGLRANGEQSAAKPADTISVKVTTLDRLVAEHGVPRYVKIDVEGFELEVVRGLSTSVPLMSVECNLPRFRDETVAIVRALEGPKRGAVFNYAVSEPPLRLEAVEWLSANEVLNVIERGGHKYLELYASCR